MYSGGVNTGQTAPITARREFLRRDRRRQAAPRAAGASFGWY